MIKVNCQECGKEFEAQRTSAKFCSANCRVKFNSKVGNPNQPQKEAQQEPETEKTVESTVTQVIGLEMVGKKQLQPSHLGFAVTKPIVYEKVSEVVSEKFGNIARIEPKTLLGDSNSKFDQLLKQFNELVDLTDKPKDIKLKLEQIKETAKNSNLTPRQSDAIVDRVNNYIKGIYKIN